MGSDRQAIGNDTLRVVSTGRDDRGPFVVVAARYGGDLIVLRISEDDAAIAAKAEAGMPAVVVFRATVKLQPVGPPMQHVRTEAGPASDGPTLAVPFRFAIPAGASRS